MTSEVLLIFSYHFTDNLLAALEFVIFIVVILSWFKVERNKFTIFLSNIAGPVLKLAKKVTPRIGMFDFSPIVAFLSIDIIRWLLSELFIKFSS